MIRTRLALYLKLSLIAVICLTFLGRIGLEIGMYSMAHADSAQTDASMAGSAIVVLNAGAAAGSGSAAAPVLHDPIANPVDAFGDLSHAWKVGWSSALLVAIWLLLDVAAWAGTRKDIAWLAWFGSGRRAFYIAGALAITTAMFNSLALGGGVGAVAGAGFAAYLANKQAKKPDATTPAPASS